LGRSAAASNKTIKNRAILDAFIDMAAEKIGLLLMWAKVEKLCALSRVFYHGDSNYSKMTLLERLSPDYSR
ncbi:MAG TPA: hypothetical protein VEQ40_08790, partial [Pyrinomonadaceae bacterium]|nr:hypothetical protein [Pyrinomonadaceae bacterium]